jgi:FkbM family methyltransferase
VSTQRGPVGRFARRALGWIARRTDRPELLAAFYAGAREAWREEVAIAAVLASALRDDSTYVDLGTNRGQVLREALRVAPRGRHIAFEPIPDLAAQLAASLPQVDTRQLALGAATGSADFCHFRKLDGWSGLRRSPEISDTRGDPEQITVQVSTLDIELAQLRPDVIKIDVEGAELDVLAGGREVLTRARPLVIFEHVATAAALYGSSSAAVWDLLSELGYEIFSVTGDGPVPRAAFAGNTSVVNWLARPGSVAAAARVGDAPASAG